MFIRQVFSNAVRQFVKNDDLDDQVYHAKENLSYYMDLPWISVFLHGFTVEFAELKIQQAELDEGC